MLASLFGYFFGMIMVLTAAVVVLTGISNISTIANGRHHLRPSVIGRTVAVEVQRHSQVAKPVIGPTVAVEVQRHSQVAKEETPTKDVSPVVATDKADTKKSKHYKPKVFAHRPNNSKVFARRPNNYGNALGYAEESRYGPSGLFFR
jgi:hypothetical protein